MRFASKQRTKLQQAVYDYLDGSPELEPSPEFDFVIGWCENYEALFQNKYSERTSIDAIAKKSVAIGRVLISGRGGAAKTVIIRRLARKALKSDDLAVVLDLRKWTSQHYEQWKILSSTVERMDYLFSSLGFPQFSVMQLDALPPSVARIVFIDGLNEVTQNMGQDIISTVDDYAPYAIHTGIIVADRMVRRTFIDSQRWALSTVLPLQPQEVRQQLKNKFGNSSSYDEADSSTRELLSSPYFLNSLLKDNIPAAHTSSESIHRYFINHASLSDIEIDELSVAAYRAYERSRSRTFSLDSFRQDAGIQITKKLIDTNTLIVTGDSASFDHHLKHDFLAARYVVSHQEIWSPDVLGILTFDASSFDSLFMALQQTSTTEIADRFVRRIYDWNPYGAAYALTEGGSQGRTLVSPQMEMVIITMLAERQWDLLKSTQTKAKDALSLFPPDKVWSFISADGIENLFQIVQKIESPWRWFDEWKSLFTLSSKRNQEAPDLRLLREDDSLLGWTFANVLKRLPLSDELQGSLRAMIGDANRTVRWRIVHVLGSFPNEPNAALLFSRLENDDYHWVRYGATRSLVEMAAIGSKDIRDIVFAGFRKHAAKLLEDKKSMQEFEAAIFIDKKRAPEYWAAMLAPIIETFYNMETTYERREQWRQLAYRLKGEYGF